MHKGSCLCGAVNFEVTGDLPAPTACHCSQCRKHSGHFEASSDIPRGAVTIHGEKHVTWYRTENVQRGFCGTCGSSLFFNPDGIDWIAISMGAFDTPTGTKLKMHVFHENQGDYYSIDDGLPRLQPT